MRCRCGLLQDVEGKGEREPYLCDTCEGEGWALGPAGYFRVASAPGAPPAEKKATRRRRKAPADKPAPRRRR